jgi:hypothetical protein
MGFPGAPRAIWCGDHTRTTVLRPQALIAAMSGFTPMMFITRVRL